jgi:hypothetical protein
MSELALEERLSASDWTFRGIKAKEGIHAIHSYPAMMPPPVARRLVRELTKEGDTVLDPFCGSGTVLAEALLLKRIGIGYDINPLALLIARVKTTPLSPATLREALFRIEQRAVSQTEPLSVPHFPNIDYWFKREVITALAKLKIAIDAEAGSEVRDFFKVVFARTARQTSNTRGNEFKLFRLPDEKLRFFRPDVFVSFKTIALECISAMDDFYSRVSDDFPSADVRFHDSRHPFPLPKESISLMLTSPPYGDSRTTVAYGQFSRLALQWLDMWEKDVDKESLGGKPIARCCEVPSLSKVLEEVRVLDERRSKEVEAFYQDLYLCIVNISTVVKAGGFAVFVIANRKVKGVTLPSDKIIVDMAQSMGFSHIGTLQREIPNKRMPLRNSPSNIPGQTDVTMLKELIVLLRKQPN